MKKFILLILFVLSATVSGCQKQVVDNKNILNSSSPLLTALVQRTDFGNDWQWIDTDMVQPSPAAPIANHERSDSAAIILTGFYGAERYYVKIYHGVERYIGPVSWIKTTPIEFHNDGQPISLDITQAGNSTSTKCIKASDVFACQIIVGYQHIVSIMTIYAPSQMGEQALTEMVNMILNVGDSHIKRIDD
jgi:hypothetical protein